MPKVCLATPSTFGLGTLLGVAIVNSVGGVYREARGSSGRARCELVRSQDNRPRAGRSHKECGPRTFAAD